MHLSEGCKCVVVFHVRQMLGSHCMRRQGCSTVSAICSKYADQEGIEKQKPPSRVEALSAFIWNRFVATKDESGPEKLYSVHHAVNLRPRFEPPQPESSFGNLFSVAITVPTLNSGEEDHHGLVRQVREQIKKIDADYVKKLQQQSNQFLDFMRDHAAKFIKGEVVTFNFTSLCRFPLYEADFVWGKPTWFGSPALTFKNLVFFVDTPSGDGIEAYVSLKKEDMAKFESDEEFHTFVSPTYSDHFHVERIIYNIFSVAIRAGQNVHNWTNIVQYPSSFFFFLIYIYIFIYLCIPQVYLILLSERSVSLESIDSVRI
jgi:hypothetical protein